MQRPEVASLSIAAAHLSVPWLLRGAIRAGRLPAEQAGPTYDRVTLRLACLALLATGRGGPRAAARARSPVLIALGSAVAGAGLPLVLAPRTSAGHAAPAVRVGDAGPITQLVAVAVAEEILWRRPCLPWQAELARLAGFTALHAPQLGSRCAYHALTGGCFATASRAGGTWAGAAAHVAHNLVVRSRSRSRPTTGRRPPEPVGVPTGLPPTVDW